MSDVRVDVAVVGAGLMGAATAWELTRRGVSVALIEQFATVALGLANNVHIMEGGSLRFSGTASELKEKPELLQSAYLLRGSSGENGSGKEADG